MPEERGTDQSYELCDRVSVITTIKSNLLIEKGRRSFGGLRPASKASGPGLMPAPLA